MTNYHLWLDFETTGLRPQEDTVLETAWTITTEDLEMLTPLRSRLCNISPRNVEFAIGDRTDGADGDWKHGNRVSPFVREMHEESGLRNDLERAASDPVESLRLLTTARDLERLLREDLAVVGYDRFEDTLILSGAGVSHFDNRVLGYHLPGMFPLGGNGHVGYAYWQHDVSVARRVIGEEAWEYARSRVNSERVGWRVYGCQVLLPEAEGYAPIRVNRVPDAEEFGAAPFVFMPDQFTAHRAADDVAQALIDGRILRLLASWSAK